MKRALLTPALALAVFFAGSSAAHPSSLIEMKDGKPVPGAVTAWTGSGKKIELTLRAGSNAEEIASQIQNNVEGVKKAKVRAGKILVVGLEQDALLAALAGMEPGDGDDLGELAAAAMGDEEDSGSSIRAKKVAKEDKRFKDRGATVIGRVVSVDRKTFPRATVRLRVLRAPTGALGKKIRKGKTITLRPAFTRKGKRIRFEAAGNADVFGAWYLQPKDSVRVHIKKQSKDGFVFDAISR